MTTPRPFQSILVVDCPSNIPLSGPVTSPSRARRVSPICRTNFDLRDYDRSMFKRVIWWATGAVAGTVGSRWLERKAKRVVAEKVAAAAPGMIARKIGSAVRSQNDATRSRIRSSITEGRHAARDRETQLRSKLSKK